MPAASDTVEQALARFGVPYDRYWDKFANVWGPLAGRHTPSGPQPGDCSWFPSEVAAHMIARGILYYKKSPGDCGKTTALGSNLSSGLKYSQLGLGSVAAASSTPALVGAAGLTAATAGAIGLATFGVGLAIVPVMAIVQHHIQAVAKSEGTICAVAGASLEAIPQIDVMVAQGKLTAQQGVDALAQLITQLKTALEPVSGIGKSGHPCNAGCCYQAILDCHLDFAKIWYPELSPMATPTAPGAVNATAPANTARSIVDELFPPPGSPQSSNVVGGLSIGWLFILAGIGLAVFVAVKK